MALDFLHGLRCFWRVLMAAAICAGSSTSFAQSPSSDCKPPYLLSGTISGEGASAAFIIGVRWGSGVLRLNDGQTFPFNVRGLKLIEQGARVMEVEGEVYNLYRLEDFVGNYDGMTPGTVPIKNEGDIVLRNSRCVLIVARHKSAGVSLSPPTPEGLTFQFDRD